MLGETKSRKMSGLKRSIVLPPNTMIKGLTYEELQMKKAEI